MYNKTKRYVHVYSMEVRVYYELLKKIIASGLLAISKKAFTPKSYVSQTPTDLVIKNNEADTPVIITAKEEEVTKLKNSGYAIIGGYYIQDSSKYINKNILHSESIKSNCRILCC